MFLVDIFGTREFFIDFEGYGQLDFTLHALDGWVDMNYHIEIKTTCSTAIPLPYLLNHLIFLIFN